MKLFFFFFPLRIIDGGWGRSLEPGPTCPHPQPGGSFLPAKAMGPEPRPLLGAVSNRHPWGAVLAALEALGSPRLSVPDLAVGQVPLTADCQIC